MSFRRTTTSEELLILEQFYKEWQTEDSNDEKIFRNTISKLNSVKDSSGDWDKERILQWKRNMKKTIHIPNETESIEEKEIISEITRRKEIDLYRPRHTNRYGRRGASLYQTIKKGISGRHS